MTRIDWFILRRMGSRMAVTVVVFFGLIVLAEALDTWRFNNVAQRMGLGWALVMVLASAMRWAIKTLPVTVLLGAIIGMIELKARHELTVIKASGISIWRVAAPLAAAVFAVSLAVATVVETWSTGAVRDLAPMPPGEAALLTPPGEVWLEQRNGDGRYVIMAERMEASGSVLRTVTVFALGEDTATRYEADMAELRNGHWLMPDATVATIDAPRRMAGDLALPTSSTAAEIKLKLTSVEDVTFFELMGLLQAGITDPAVRAAATTRFLKLVAMPLTLVGSLLIAFAFTAGYRRSAKYGPAVLYGVALGFVVFIVSEMSERAGSGGVLHPAFAALGPAFVAIVIGVTVLLYKEDGRA